jgi:DNA processing protein
MNSKYYPERLKNIDEPPKELYCLGNLELLNYKTNIAIIGSRNCSLYGERAAKDFAYNLAKEDMCIVSGLAKGIDSFAHIGAVKAKGKTIAVLGSGLDNIYPKENMKLVEEIIKNKGLVISEYPLGTKPLKYHFPARNRIISGLSDGVLVVEARKNSGTNITVDFALEQGKDVFVIPGNIYSKTSDGTNYLITEGAIPVLSYKDILNTLNYRCLDGYIINFVNLRK